MKPQKNEDKISKIMNDSNRVISILRSGVGDALLKHKQAGNPVCEWKNNKVVWILPDNIPVKQVGAKK